VNVIESTKLENDRSFFEKIYNEIMNSSPDIRFVTIIDFNGRLMFGGQREGISNYLNPSSEKESLRHAIEAWNIRDKFTDSIGQGKYALVEYEKIKRITIPFDKNHLVFLTAEVTVNHDELIARILQLVKQNKTNLD
jgi:Family of unknown function (DUF6659)